MDVESSSSSSRRDSELELTAAGECGVEWIC